MKQKTTDRTPQQSGRRGRGRGGATPEAFAQALIDNLHCLQAKLPQHATRNDWYMALAYTVRDRMLERYISTIETITTATPRRSSPTCRPSS